MDIDIDTDVDVDVDIDTDIDVDIDVNTDIDVDIDIDTDVFMCERRPSDMCVSVCVRTCLRSFVFLCGHTYVCVRVSCICFFLPVRVVCVVCLCVYVEENTWVCVRGWCVCVCTHSCLYWQGSSSLHGQCSCSKTVHSRPALPSPTAVTYFGRMKRRLLYCWLWCDWPRSRWTGTESTEK